MSMKINDIIFYGSAIILIVLAFLLKGSNYHLTEIWWGLLFITIILPKYLFRNSRFAQWLDNEIVLKKNTTVEIDEIDEIDEINN